MRSCYGPSDSEIYDWLCAYGVDDFHGELHFNIFVTFDSVVPNIFTQKQVMAISDFCRQWNLQPL